MTTNNLEHLTTTQLVLRMETIDYHCRKQQRLPSVDELFAYHAGIRELVRRGQRRITPYYEIRYAQYHDAIGVREAI